MDFVPLRSNHDMLAHVGRPPRAPGTSGCPHLVDGRKAVHGELAGGTAATKNAWKTESLGVSWRALGHYYIILYIYITNIFINIIPNHYDRRSWTNISKKRGLDDLNATSPFQRSQRATPQPLHRCPATLRQLTEDSAGGQPGRGGRMLLTRRPSNKLKPYTITHSMGLAYINDINIYIWHIWVPPDGPPKPPPQLIGNYTWSVWDAGKAQIL